MPHVETPQGRCRLGLGRRDVTPPVGIYHRLWGAASHDRATGVHRPLSATALVFQAAEGPVTPDSEQILVAIDLCLLWWEEMQALLAKVCRRHGLDARQILCVFSHTHSSGLPGLERVELPGGDLIPAYLDHLANQVGEAIDAARQAVQPVTLVFGTGTCTMAANRDFWDETSKQFVCGFNPNGPVDPNVLVAKAVDGTGQTVVSLVNYACHPTTLAWGNTLISPDFPGAMVEVVEKANGAPCVFLQGASGDIGPKEGFVGDLAVAERNGRQLGYAALAALEGLPPPGTRFAYIGPVISGATIGTWAHEAVDAAARERQGRWGCRRWTVPLPFRDGLPTRAQTEAELARWQAAEDAARRAEDEGQARDCRALAERMRRQLQRLSVLPPGATFPFPITMWRTGDALWLAVEAEHYNVFQRALRERFAGTPIVVMTLANGSRVAYLPSADAYGKGLYEDSIALLAPGSLEYLLEAIGNEIESWQRD